MMYPPSLPDDVKARAFRAGNGELGVLPADAPAFLAACRKDNVKVLGWELWVVDHSCSFDTNSVVPAIGWWCGLIPVQNEVEPTVIAGDGGVDEAEGQLASVDLNAEVQPAFLPYIRVNFTLVEHV
jgi:hypothetical protein